MVVNPRSLTAQLNGGVLPRASPTRSTSGWSTTRTTALSLARRFYSNRPLTILDVPHTMPAVALGIPDPETPVGAQGRRRTARRRRLRRGAERHCRRHRRRRLPAGAGDIGRRADVTDARQADARRRCAHTSKNPGTRSTRRDTKNSFGCHACFQESSCSFAIFVPSWSRRDRRTDAPAAARRVAVCLR